MWMRRALLLLLLVRSPAAAAGRGSSSSVEEEDVTCEAATSSTTNGDNSYCQPPDGENVTTRATHHSRNTLQQPQRHTPKLYLYHNAINNKDGKTNGAVVQEYLVRTSSSNDPNDDDDDGDTNSTTPSMARVLGIPHGSTHNDYYYSMVTFYLPYCDGCKKLQAAYVDLSQRVQELMMQDVVIGNHHSSSAPSLVFHQSLAVSCHTQAHRALCDREQIAQYPTLRLYQHHSSNHQGKQHEEIITLSQRDMHPFVVLEQWGVVRKLQEETEEHPRRDSSSSALQLMSTLAHFLRDLYEHHKDVAANPRDPPLPLPLAQALLIFLHMLDQAVAVWTDPHSNHLRTMLRDLLTSAYYILRHQGWLNAILDEHLESAGIIKDISTARKTKEEDNVSDGMWDWLLTLQQGVAAWNAAAVLPSTQITNLVEKLQDLLREADQTTASVWCGGKQESSDNDNDTKDDDDCRHLFLEQPLPRPLAAQPPGVDPDRSLALWLAKLRWQWQQRQSRRTLQDDTVWPPREQCPRCWTKSALTNRRPNPSQPSWNEAVVYDYIRLEYGSSSWLTMSEREQQELRERVYGRRDGNDNDGRD